MANSPQARKRARQNNKRRDRNRSYRSSIRTSIKAFLAAISNNDNESASAAFSKTSSMIDKGASKGLYHKNRAARMKSRLNARLSALAAA